MSEQWQYQLRVYLNDDMADVARSDRNNPALQPLTNILNKHHATLMPAKRAKHIKTFALHVSGNEVYAKEVADALEADLQSLVGGALVTRMSKHDTNPANNLQVPPVYRS
jgi:hypothetical protein